MFQSIIQSDMLIDNEKYAEVDPDGPDPLFSSSHVVFLDNAPNNYYHPFHLKKWACWKRSILPLMSIHSSVSSATTDSVTVTHDAAEAHVHDEVRVLRADCLT